MRWILLRTLGFVGITLLQGCGLEPAAAPAEPASSGTGQGVFQPAAVTVQLPAESRSVLIEFDAVFRNAGESPLRILEVETSCSCALVGEVPDVPLAPGEQRIISLSITPPAGSSRTVRVSVVTSPPSPDAVLTIEAAGRPAELPFVDEMTSQIDLTVSEADSLVEGRASVFSQEPAGADPWLAGVSLAGAVPAGWSAAIEGQPQEHPSLHAGAVRRTYGIVVRGDAGDITGDIRFTALLQTRAGVSGEHAAAINVFVRRAPMIRAAPVELVWAAGEITGERTVLLVFAEEDEWVLSDPTGLPEWMAVTVSPLGAGPATKRFRALFQCENRPLGFGSFTVGLSASSPSGRDANCEVSLTSHPSETSTSTSIGDEE